MKTVNIAELRNRLSHYLADVRAGREILVRDRDTPIALIVPISHREDGDAELMALAASGAIRLGSGPIGADLWELPAPRVALDALRRAVEAERDGE